MLLIVCSNSEIIILERFFFFFQVAKNTSYWPSVRHLKNIVQLPSVHNVQKVLGQYYVCFQKHFTIQILPVRPVYTCTQLMHALSVDIMGISSPDQFLPNYITHRTAVSILPCKACFPKRLYFDRKKGIRKEMGSYPPTPTTPFSLNTSLMLLGLWIRDI